ncbi:hypothetical protein M434DRAFT_382415 [Hypoxylon sp. CO27-5]|nr:hypothetical protein M434DRAFT_382415 [Hypoxylon sp. CO27-5]
MGIVAYTPLPHKWIPYAQLMRIDRPAGFYAFYFPYLIGIMYSACITPIPPAPTTLLALAVVLFPFNILLRGAACSWNDNVDQDFDRRVERCRHRPVARGCSQLAAGYPILLFFPKPCIPHMLVTVILFSIYALMKRVTYYPQVFLGFPFAWAILFCVAALADDEKAGVKSMALRFKNSTKLLASLLAIGQAGLLALCGLWAGFGTIYFVGTAGGVATAMAYYIYKVDLKRPESCGAWFHDQFWLVGAGFMAGLTGEYAIRRMAYTA